MDERSVSPHRSIRTSYVTRPAPFLLVISDNSDITINLYIKETMKLYIPYVGTLTENGARKKNEKKSKSPSVDKDMCSNADGFKN